MSSEVKKKREREKMITMYLFDSSGDFFDAIIDDAVPVSIGGPHQDAFYALHAQNFNNTPCNDDYMDVYTGHGPEKTTTNTTKYSHLLLDAIQQCKS